MSISCPDSDAIQSSHPLLPPSPLAFNLSQHQGLFGSSRQMVKVLELQLQPSVLLMNIHNWFPLGLTSSPCCPRDSQEPSPAPQFESINSSAPSLLYGQTLTSIHDYWKNKTIALTISNLFGKLMSLLFNTLSRFARFSSNEQASFNFMAAVTICSDFEALEKKVSHYFHCFPIYLPWSDETNAMILVF